MERLELQEAGGRGSLFPRRQKTVEAPFLDTFITRVSNLHFNNQHLTPFPSQILIPYPLLLSLSLSLSLSVCLCLSLSLFLPHSIILSLSLLQVTSVNTNNGLPADFECYVDVEKEVYC